MRAAAIFSNGSLDVIGLEDLPDPSPQSGQAVVRLKAAAANHLDIWVRKGGRAEMRFPHVFGSDGAGVVEQVGPGVGSLTPGQEVVINPGLSCGACDHCVAGRHSLCENFGILGLNCWGTFAQKVVLPSQNLRSKPTHLNWIEAAALPLAHLTAWRMLVGRANVHAGERVLIHGIGGGVALAGLQLAKVLGAEVIATSSSPDKLQNASQLGADHAIDYKHSDVAAEVKQITGGRGVDVILDTVGAATWPLNFACARRGGRIVHCGVTGGSQAPADIRALYWNQFTVMGSTLGSGAEFAAMLQAVSVARLKPVIDSVWPLEQVRQAQGKMENAEQFGKIVVTIDQA